MQRRQFIQKASALSLLATGMVSAKGLTQQLGDATLHLNPYIWPEERIEKREYDNSKPNAVVWHTAPYQLGYPKKEVLSTVGFVEGVADESKILHIPGILVRRDNPIDGHTGFYLYFSISFVWLSLPRRTSKNPDVILDRYAFDSQYSMKSSGGFNARSISIDLRDIKIIEDNKIYHPEKEVLNPIDPKTGALLNVSPSLIPVTGTMVFPSKDYERSGITIQKTLFFNIAHRPLRFKLELPSLFILGVEVPLPVCYFEPYDITSDKWM